MAVNVGASKRPIPGGGTKYYPTGLIYSNVNDDGLVQYMQQNSQVSETAARSAVKAFKAAFETFLINGHTMVIPSLGTFSLSAQCKAQTSVEDVNVTVKNIRIRFTPTAQVRRAAESAKFVMLPVDDVNA